MEESLTPEQERAKAIAELMAMPGPKPLKPIPPEIKAEIKREMEWESYEDYTILMIKEMEEFGCCSGNELLDIFDGRSIYWPASY